MLRSIEETMVKVKGKVGIKELNPAEECVFCSFVGGHDVFVCLPTGYGRLYLFATLRATCLGVIADGQSMEKI